MRLVPDLLDDGGGLAPVTPVAEYLRALARHGRFMLRNRRLTTSERAALTDWLGSFEPAAAAWEAPEVPRVEAHRAHPPSG